MDYLVPNDLVNNATYLANDAIPTILKSLRKFLVEFCAKCFYISFFCSSDIDDPTGQIAKDLEAKYMVGADMGNFTSMTPGLTDVIKNINERLSFAVS